MAEPPPPKFTLDPARAWRNRTITPNDLINLSKQLAETGTRIAVHHWLFEDCIFEGPMILFPYGETQFNSPVFDLRGAPIDAILWPREGSTIGAIALIACLLDRCTFSNVGITAHQSQIVEFKATWVLGGND